MREFIAKYHLKGKTVAAAVSGGADSLALALRLKEAGCKVVALTVDHGLRQESGAEAAYVGELMKNNDIEHHILVWNASKPQNGIEEAARQARYRLMLEFCRQRGIKFLATGHHRRDQAETFLLRLQRGSGVFGLSAMLPISYRDGVALIRPQLNEAPEDLRDYLRRRHIRWVEDPMNQDDDFARVKIRRFLPQLTEIGLDEKRLADTAAILCRTRLFIQELADKFVATSVRFWADAAASLSYRKLTDLHEEVARPVLGQLINRIGGGDYPPEADEVRRILTEGDDFRGCTLGGCELFIATKRLWIVPQDKKNRLMSKAEWESFAAVHPEYRNTGLPYKVRRALKEKLKD